MSIVTILILFVLLLMSYLIARSLLHPAVITSVVWLVLLTLYNTLDTGLYRLSDNFYNMVLCWTVPFVLVALIESPFSAKAVGSNSTYPTIRTFTESKIIHSLLRFFVPICAIISFLAMTYRGYIYNPGNIFNGIRQASVATIMGVEPEIQFPFIVQVALQVSQSLLLPYCLYLLFIKKEYSKYTYSLLFLLVVYVILKSNKTIIATVVCAFFCIAWYQKLINRKNLLLVIIVVVGLFAAAHLLRRIGSDKEFNLLDFAMTYLFSALPAMDSTLDFSDGYIQSFHGEFTFRGFTKIFSLIDPRLVGNDDAFNISRWVNVPIPTNVYTILFPFYTDFGSLGLIIFGSLYGLFFSYSYKRMVKYHSERWLLIYSCTVYILIFQFFIDFGMMFFWANILIIMCILLLTIPKRNSIKPN